MTLVAVFGLVGIVFELSRRRWLLPVWFFLPFVVEPRSAPTVAMIPLAMLAGICLSEVIFPAIAGVASGTAQWADQNVFRGRAVPLFLLFLGLYVLGNTAYFGSQMAASKLTAADRDSFSWVKANTPANSRFLVLSGSEELFCDSIQEWFPALTERTSITTIQGREWMDGGGFGQFAADSRAIQGCLSSVEPLACAERLIADPEDPLEFDYIYLARSTPIFTACRTTQRTMKAERMIAELSRSTNYSQVLSTDEAAVFKRLP